MQYAVESAVDVRVGGDVVAQETEAVVPHQVRDILRMARDEVVEADDVVALGKEAVAEVRSEKTGRAGDEDSHVLPPRPIDA